MTRLLLIIATICIFFSCKKHPVEPVPQPPINNSPVNYLPKRVISSSTNSFGRIHTTFTYYPDSLVKTISKSNIDIWPLTKDSTILVYNSNKMVTNKKLYTNNTLVEDTYIYYTVLGKVDNVSIQYTSSQTVYEYHYKTNLEVDYILTFDDNILHARDSIAADGNLFTHYVYMLNDTPNHPAPDGYIESNTEYHYASPNGVHEQIPICLNLSIGFQTELAESFLEMGEINFPYRNYFYIPSSRQYCSSVNARIFTYTFDTHNRLTTIHEEITNSLTPGDVTSQIYY